MVMRSSNLEIQHVVACSGQDNEKAVFVQGLMQGLVVQAMQSGRVCVVAWGMEKVAISWPTCLRREAHNNLNWGGHRHRISVQTRQLN